jgi:hypothetical protein
VLPFLLDFHAESLALIYFEVKLLICGEILSNQGAFLEQWDDIV